MLHIARVAMINCNRLRKLDISGAVSELEKAKDLLENSIRLVLLCHNLTILDLNLKKEKEEKKGFKKKCQQ